MPNNYTIYQQALDLQASGFDQYSLITFGIGLAKFLQILLPQIAYVVVSMILTPVRLLPLARILLSEQSTEMQLRQTEKWLTVFHRLQGFFIWKLACDLGFFLIVTQYGSWLRAFTLSGLLTYTVLQFVVYYLIGQRLIIAKLVGKNKKGRPKPIRVTWWKNLASKLLYEEMGVTISQVTGRVVLVKILVDYAAMWITWSAYTIGFFAFANGNLGFAPLFIFPHVSMSSLYISIYIGYAMLFTILEFVLKRFSLNSYTPLWSKKVILSTQFKQLAATVAVTLVVPILISLMTETWKVIGQVTSAISGVRYQWLISLKNNAPQWLPNRPLSSHCDAQCLQDMFIRGNYTSHD